MLLLKVLVLCFLLFKACSGNVGDVIAEFLEEQRRPSKVVGFLCWQKYKITYLAKQLSKKDILFSSYSTENYNNELLPTFWPEEHQVYILDLQCRNAEAILKTANRTMLLGYPKRWLVLQRCSSNFNFKPYNVYLNSRIYVFTSCNLTHIITSPFKVGPKTKLESNVIGFFNGGRFSKLNRLFDGKNRSDLNGLALNAGISYFYDSTADHLEDFRELEKDAYAKHNYILFSHIVDVLNVTARIVTFHDWGSLKPNSTIYGGLIGHLQQGNSELSGSVAFMTADRIPILDYVAATTSTQGRFVFRAPPLSLVANVLTLPFDTFVWYACYTTVVVIFVVLYVIIKWEWSNSFRRNVEGKQGAVRPTALDVIQVELGAVLQQGSEGEPMSVAGRIAFFVIFLSLLFLYTSYCANIIALLQSTSDNLRTLDDLLNSKIKLGIRDLPFYRYILKMDHGPVQNEIIRTKFGPLDEPGTYMSLAEGVEQMRSDFFAFYADADGIYKEVNRVFREGEKCGLKEVAFLNGIVDPYVISSKNSTYKELVKIGYAKLFERGLQTRNYKRVFTSKPKCSGEGSNFTSVSLNDLYFALLCFIIGTGASLLILLAEIASVRLKKN